MARHIKKCLKCKLYTMEDKCPQCDGDTVLPRPPKFSLKDKYAGMKREIKKKGLAEKNLY